MWGHETSNDMYEAGMDNDLEEFDSVDQVTMELIDLFKKLIVRKPLGVFLDNTMEQRLTRNSSFNFRPFLA